MRRTLVLLLLVVATGLSVAATASAAPGNGKNAVLIFNDCDSGVGQITLVSQASLNGLYATAHVVGTNRPAPLVSLNYELYDGAVLIDSGGYAHPHPQQGHPLVTCNGSFTIDGLRFEITVTAFFPAGA